MHPVSTSTSTSAHAGPSTQHEPGPEDLLARVLAGSEAAWRELVHEYGGLVRASAGRFRLQPCDVEEVAQNTWLRLLERGHGVRDARCLPAWLATTASREALRLLSRGSRLVEVDPTVLLEVSAAGPVGEVEDVAQEVVDELDQVERAAALHQELAGLPDRWRALLVALVRDERPQYERVSRESGVPVGSIGPTRGRALRRLRGGLQERGALVG